MLRRGGFCGVTGRNSPEDKDDYEGSEHDDADVDDDDNDDDDDDVDAHQRPASESGSGVLLLHLPSPWRPRL